MPDGLKERFACWKLRMFVRFFRRDICVKHARVRELCWNGFMRKLCCPICEDEARQAELRAELQWELDRRESLKLYEAATEEILNALKYCGRKRG